MESDFIESLERHLASREGKISPDEMAAIRRFALSSRERGAQFLEFLLSVTGIKLDRLRVLDIGSAYGGFVIQAAKYGADSYGIELIEYLHNLALANAKDEPEKIHLIHGDFLNAACRKELGEKAFDVIIINDVFEHVFDVEHLFYCIRELCHPETLIYFAVPNGESYHSIAKEGHKCVFGLTLLEPGLWAKAVGAFNIYYRPLSLYKFFIQLIDMKNVYLKFDRSKVDSAPQRIHEGLDSIRKKISENPFNSNDQNEMASRRLEILQQKIARDLKSCSPLEIHIKYEMHFWEGVATSKLLKPTSRNPLVEI